MAARFIRHAYKICNRQNGSSAFLPARSYFDWSLLKIQAWLEHILANDAWYLGAGPADSHPRGVYDHLGRLCVVFSRSDY